jgi:2,3-bisphosphoglycerate-independent phosphoglycerate mutase
MSTPYRPLVLLILDGWGYTEQTEYNAIYQAPTPVWDRLWREQPRTFLRASGAEVGLPSDQMGNSEVGHLNLGSGRVVYQEYTRISRAIRTGSFFTNITITNAVDQAMQNQRALHIFGLLSPGGVHSHEEHIQAMVELAVKRGAPQVYLHAFLDGRDTPPKSAESSIRLLEETFARAGGGRFATLCGRYYAMDRDHRWPRVEQAYNALALGQAEHRAADALTGLQEAYAREETDEFVKPTLIVPPGTEPVQIQDGDVVVFMNFRSDRARELTRAFIEEEFDGFTRQRWPRLGMFMSLTAYHKNFDIPVAFPPEKLNNVFGEYISHLGLRQLRIAETEKYAHVTFFFNGGRETVYEGEDRILIESPPVKTYDLQPEMSAFQLTERLIEAIKRKTNQYDVIICNYANADMVGHTGDFPASLKAVEAVDSCLGRVLEAIAEVGGEALITADHGNIEKMRDDTTGQPHTAHTTNLVPFIYFGQRGALMRGTGVLADVAPTMLYLMGLPQPPEMRGHALIELSPAHTAE